MPTSLHAPAPPLSNLLGSMLITSLPAGPYVRPATLQPMLMLVLSGQIQLQQVLPEGFGFERRTLSPANLCGASRNARMAEAAPGTRILLASIRPGQLPRLFGFSANAVIDQLLPLADLVARWQLADFVEKLNQETSNDAQAACFERFLLALHMNQATRSTDLVLPEAWQERQLSAIAGDFNLSPRQFERHFITSYGQSLRSFRQQARCSRLISNRVFGHNDIGNWADTAVAAGYFDQAHLSRDIRRFTSYTPSTLSRRMRDSDPALWPFRLTPAQALRVFGTSAF